MTIGLAIGIPYLAGWLTTAILLVRDQKPYSTAGYIEVGTVGLIAGSIWPIWLLGYLIGLTAQVKP